MRALVTGAAGFIGSRLTARLLDGGHDVVGLDCFTPYYPREAKEEHLSLLRDHPAFRFEEADLRTARLESLLEADVAFHLAAQPGVRRSWGASFPEYAEHNVLATQRLLEACRAAGTGRLVFASSSSVYGEAEAHPTPEDARCRPVSPYGVTKLAAEHLVEAYAATFGVQAVALRYFTVYGPGQRPDMAFHRFITAILDGAPIEIYGDGEQTRDVTFVDDAVEATAAAADAPAAAGPINVGGGSRVSVNEAVRILADATGREPALEHRPGAAGDVRHTSAELTRARNLLGYRPKVGLEEGLRREVEWLEELRARAV
jgi:UDP-glucose 4-epimerase